MFKKIFLYILVFILLSTVTFLVSLEISKKDPPLNIKSSKSLPALDKGDEDSSLLAGKIAYKKGLYSEAINQMHKGRIIAEKRLNKNNLKLAVIYNDLGYTYKEIGKFHEAMEWYNKALNISENVLGTDHEFTARVYSNIAYAFYEQKKYEDSLKWHKKALKVNEKNNSLDITTTYNDISLVYSSQKNYDEALKWNLKALKIREEKLGKEHIWTATTYHNIAFNYYNKGEFEKALEYNNKALAVRKKHFGDNHPLVALSIKNIGDVLRDQKKYEEAIDHYKQALEIVTKLKFERRMALYESSISFVYEIQGKQQKAIEHLDRAIQIYENLRNYSNSEADKISISETLVNYYGKAIRLSYAMQDYKSAFNYMEMSKARLLIQSIASQEAKLSASISENDLKQLNNLENNYSTTLKTYKAYLSSQFIGGSEEVSQENAESENTSTDKPVETINPEEKEQLLKEKYLTARNELDAFREELDKKYPEYSEFRFPQPITYDEIAKIFKTKSYTETALVEFFISIEDLYIITITKDGIEGASRRMDQTEFDYLISTFTGPFHKIISTSNAIQFFTVLYGFDTNIAHRLYRKLFIPVDKFLQDDQGNFKYKNLIIVPHKKLFYVPFEALLTKKTEKPIKNQEILFKEYASLPYLVKEVNISYLPTALILKLIDKKNRSNKNDKELLIFANPDFSYLKDEFSLSQLKYSDREGIMINKLYKGGATLLAGKQATEGAFWENADHYKSYHIASHGFANDKDPYMSAIILAKGTEKDTKNKPNDGILYAYELIGQKLPLDTIVLSACETGLGKMEAGEGMVGLSRSFFIAGVNSAIISLWSVSDQSTSELMIKYYTNRRTQPKAQALAKAKEQLMETVVENESGNKMAYAHPYFWAPFVLSGEWK
jgi:CHAT domain-containing protein